MPTTDTVKESATLMSVDIWIERRAADGSRQPISDDEWRHAVLAIPSARIMDEPSVANNPRTGARIAVPSDGLDVAYFDPEEDDWIRAIRFRKGVGTTRYTSELEDADHPLRVVLRSLCRQLDCVLRVEDDILPW